jgi:hypothetical protein
VQDQEQHAGKGSVRRGREGGVGHKPPGITALRYQSITLAKRLKVVQVLRLCPKVDVRKRRGRSGLAEVIQSKSRPLANR